MVLENFRLDNKIALITGASYGIGFAITKVYLKPEQNCF